MKVAYLGVLLSASFLELTSHEDEARVVQCVLTYPETNKIILKSVSVCLTKSFNKIEHEKKTLAKILSKMYPYEEDKNKEEIRSQRREIWHTYLTSSTKRRKLVPGLVKQLSEKAQIH